MSSEWQELCFSKNGENNRKYQENSSHRGRLKGGKEKWKNPLQWINSGKTENESSARDHLCGDQSRRKQKVKYNLKLCTIKWQENSLCIASYADRLMFSVKINDDRIKSMFVLTFVWMHKHAKQILKERKPRVVLIFNFSGARRRRSPKFPWLVTNWTGRMRTTLWRGAGGAGGEWRMER